MLLHVARKANYSPFFYRESKFSKITFADIESVDEIAQIRKILNEEVT